MSIDLVQVRGEMALNQGSCHRSRNEETPSVFWSKDTLCEQNRDDLISGKSNLQ